MEPEIFETEPQERSELGLRHLQSRYVLPYVACAVVAVLLTGLVLAGRTRTMMLDSVKSEQLVAARAGAQAVGNLADMAARFAESIATSPTATGNDFGGAEKALKSLALNSKPISSLFLMDARASLLASSHGSAAISRTLMHDPCFDRVKEGTNFCFTGVLRLGEGERRAYVFVPVFSGNGGVSRVLIAGIDLEDKSLHSVVLGINPGKKGFSFLVDREGKIVVSGEPDKENAIRDASDLDAVKAVLGGEMGSIVYRFGRKKMIASFYPVEPLGWGFISQRPYGEATSGAGSLYKYIFLFIVLAGGAGAALALLQTQSITRFMFMLGGRMEAVARGHLNQDIRRDEVEGFAPLVSAFNRMLESLHSEKREESQTLDDVRETARFNQGILSSIKDVFLVTDRWQAIIMANEKAESFMPVECKPCAGKGLSTLGQCWGQKRLVDAANRSIDSVEVISVSNVGFSSAAGAEPVIYDFRIYPLTSSGGGAVFYGREVSDFVAKHEKVRSSQRFYHGISVGAPDPIIVLDGDQKIEWINPAAARLLNAEDDFIGTDWRSWIADKNRNAFFSELRRSASENTTFSTMEIELQRNNNKLLVEVAAGNAQMATGELKTILTLRPVDSGRILERAALYEKPNMENKLKFMSSVIESLPDEMAVLNEQGRIITVNAAFARLFEEQKEVFIGKAFNVLSADGGPIFDPVRLEREKLVSADVNLRNLKGKKFRARIQGSAIRSGNGSRGFAFTIREIGAELEARNREKRIVEARTRTRMARTVGTRFESIVEKLNSGIKELGHNIFAPETREILDRVVEQCKDIAHASNSLMTYSTDTKLKLVTCSMDNVFEETIGAMRGKGMVPENVLIESHVDENCGSVNADADMMKLTVWHLVLNAVRAAAKHDQGGEVVVRALRTTIDETKVVLVEVMDNGPEYDVSEIQHFFEPFYSTDPESMGLGLTLSRRAVIKHNGNINIERVKGITRASFYIPLELTQSSIKSL